MKKIFFTAAVFTALAFISTAASAQNANDAIAKKAAKDAGCIGEYNGPLQTSTNDLGTCTTQTGEIVPYTETYVSAKPNPNEAPYVRIAPFARVVMCGSEVTVVECLSF